MYIFVDYTMFYLVSFVYWWRPALYTSSFHSNVWTGYLHSLYQLTVSETRFSNADFRPRYRDIEKTGETTAGDFSGTETPAASSAKSISFSAMSTCRIINVSQMLRRIHSEIFLCKVHLCPKSAVAARVRKILLWRDTVDMNFALAGGC